MKKLNSSNNSEKKKPHPSNDHTAIEKNSDHSGSDCNNDKTEIGTRPENERKFDKPTREVDPDSTGIDTKADKTKIEKTRNQKNK